MVIFNPMNELIKKFYACFDALDSQGMVDCYHEEVLFEDPAFGRLQGDDAKDMWRMLVASQKSETFDVSVSNISTAADKGSARWEAFYTFSRTGRKVHNIIDAEFTFKDGLIIEHRDSFNLHRWAKQALGFKGTLLGGTGFFKRKLNAQTRGLLKKYQARMNEGQAIGKA